MFDYDLSFGSPGYLVLLVSLPVLWLTGWRTLAGLGNVRRWVVLGVRSLVVGLLVVALAEAQMVRTSDRVTVIYLLDQSLSIPAERRRAMVEHVNLAIREHRQHDDRAGVIVFGRDAAVEVPPLSSDVQVPEAIESFIDPEHTNLAGAMKLALACFPDDSSRRIVVVSDGNENLGDALKQARQMAGEGVGIDVAAVRYRAAADVAVERLAIPADVRRSQPFDVRVVMTNTAGAAEAGEVRGRLAISQSADGESWVISEEPVVVRPGKSVFTIRQEIDEPNFYTYEARFIPEQGDAATRDNRATGFAHIRGKGRVLLIEDYENPGEFDWLIRRLRREGLDVMLKTDNDLFSSLAELQPFDAVLLADVPRERFSEDQIAMLARNTQQLGAGLVMLGGPNSFGAGGWSGTEVEKAMPVDFQIKNAKVMPTGALVLVIDRSGSMSGRKVELCKEAALASAKTLGARDYVGVVTFNSAAQWAVPMTHAGSIEAIERRVRRIGAGGGTNMRPGMELGFRGIANAEASVKHMIVLTDGQTEGQGYERLARGMFDQSITVSAVAVGPDADVALLTRVAARGGGKFYRVTNPRALPRIFMKEARRVARPLIFDRHAVQPRVVFRHPMLGGIEEPLPAIKGFVMTTVKDNPLVDVLMVSPEPDDERYTTLLASWHYGSGRAVAFTSDVGARWTGDWLQRPASADLFAQIVRWSMRPAAKAGRFTFAADVADQRVRVVVNALDEDDAYLDFLSIRGSAVGPELTSVDFGMEQVAPGRYVGEFPAAKAGSYFVSLSPGLPEMAPILCGVNVPSANEFRERTVNEFLLERLTETVPDHGQPGVLVDAGADSEAAASLATVDSFRREGLPKAIHSRDVWHEIVFCVGCLFFFDVFLRRVTVGFGWLVPLAGRVRTWAFGGSVPVSQPATIARLRGRKADIAGDIERLQMATRFGPSPEPGSTEIPRQEPTAASPLADADVPPPPLAEDASPDETYTERLLRAKHNVWD